MYVKVPSSDKKKKSKANGSKASSSKAKGESRSLAGIAIAKGYPGIIRISFQSNSSSRKCKCKQSRRMRREGKLAYVIFHFIVNPSQWFEKKMVHAKRAERVRSELAKESKDCSIAKDRDWWTLGIWTRDFGHFSTSLCFC